VIDRCYPVVRPSRFAAHVGHGLGPWFECALEDGGLSYSRFGPGQPAGGPEIITPSDEDWGCAIHALEVLGVGRWKARYEHPELDVCDGTTWSLVIDSPRLTVNSSGDEVYPRRFRAVLAVVRELLGGRDFS